MAIESAFSMTDVLAVARIHPFYASDVLYPPDADAIQAARERASKNPAEIDSIPQPFLWKPRLYSVIERLINDTSPQNVFRHSAYTSTTGGGTGSKPLFFATDVHENRQARASFGRLLRNVGLVSNRDWVVTTHFSGELYRSLDLILEILENAGASVLAAGQHISPAEVIHLITSYHANALSGDSSQIVSLVHYISTLPKEDRDKIKLDKIIYTSDGLTPSQRSRIHEVLGPVPICSILGSAEAGPYAVSCPHLTGNVPAGASHEDFIFDTRLTTIEILPLSFSENDSNSEPVEDGEQGVVVQTSHTRLRNPLVRYVTGDVGSLHSLPENTRSMVTPEADWKYLRILRLQGRNRRFSFVWEGNYFEFDQLQALMNDPNSGVLQWQVVLDKMVPSMEGSLEVRLLCSNPDEASENALVNQLETFFYVFHGNRRLFKVSFLKSIGEFRRSDTGRKVIKFINNYN